MKVQELRIGNYVNKIVTPSMQNGRIKPSIDLWRIECTDFCSFENFEPIPLTEQWLIDFGFDGKNPILFYTGWEEEVSLSDIPVGIKYVHQLQNLYFALTGEELQL